MPEDASCSFRSRHCSKYIIHPLPSPTLGPHPLTVHFFSTRCIHDTTRMHEPVSSDNQRLYTYCFISRFILIATAPSLCPVATTAYGKTTDQSSTPRPLFIAKYVKTHVGCYCACSVYTPWTCTLLYFLCDAGLQSNMGHSLRPMFKDSHRCVKSLN